MFTPTDDFSGDDFQPDFEPTFVGRFNLVSTGELYADVYVAAYLYPVVEDTFDLDLLENLFDEELDVIPLPNDIDLDKPSIRGPFFTRKHLNKFFDKSPHLRDISVIYYDELTEVYWIEITSP